MTTPKTAAQKIARSVYQRDGGIGLRALDAIGIHPTISVEHAELPALLASVHWSSDAENDADLVGSILAAVARDLRMLYTRRPTRGTRAERIARALDARAVLYNTARRAEVAAEIHRRLLVGLSAAEARTSSEEFDRRMRGFAEDAERNGTALTHSGDVPLYVVRRRPADGGKEGAP